MHKFAILIFFVVILGAMFMQSCKHEPLISPNPDPSDTSSNNGSNTGVPCHPDSVYFQNHILPLLVSNCAQPGCHSEIDKKDGVILTSYENLMKTVDKVKSTDWSKNELIEVITDNNANKRMPPAPNNKLSTEQINLLKKWVTQGALNNGCNENWGGCDTTSVKYSTDIQPLLKNKCVGCHSNSVAYGNVLLSDHASAKNVALNGKLVLSVTRTTDWMPKNGAKLDDCSIQKIKIWVAAGAPNN